MTLQQMRDKIITEAVKSAVATYIGGVRTRRCARCGGKFMPRTRWNFLCKDECRKDWNRGMFRPRRKD